MEYIILAAVLGVVLLLPILKKSDSVLIFLAAMAGDYLYSNIYRDTLSFTRDNIAADTDIVRSCVALTLSVLPVLLVAALTINKISKPVDRILGALTIPASAVIVWSSLKIALPANLSVQLINSEISKYIDEYYIYTLCAALIATTLHFVLAKPKKPKKED